MTARWRKLPISIRQKITLIETIDSDLEGFVCNYVASDDEKFNVLRDAGICPKFISATTTEEWKEYCREIEDKKTRLSEISERNLKRIKKKETSMFCENCGKPLKPTAKFCGSCGTRID